MTEIRERWVLVYSVTRDRWLVEDTTTGKRRPFATRAEAIAACDAAVVMERKRR